MIAAASLAPSRLGWRSRWWRPGFGAGFSCSSACQEARLSQACGGMWAPLATPVAVFLGRRRWNGAAVWRDLRGQVRGARKAAERTVDALWTAIGRLDRRLHANRMRQLLQSRWIRAGLRRKCSRSHERAAGASADFSRLIPKNVPERGAIGLVAVRPYENLTSVSAPIRVCRLSIVISFPRVRRSIATREEVPSRLDKAGVPLRVIDKGVAVRRGAASRTRGRGTGKNGHGGRSGKGEDHASRHGQPPVRTSSDNAERSLRFNCAALPSPGFRCALIGRSRGDPFTHGAIRQMLPLPEGRAGLEIIHQEVGR